MPVWGLPAVSALWLWQLWSGWVTGPLRGLAVAPIALCASGVLVACLALVRLCLPHEREGMVRIGREPRFLLFLAHWSLRHLCPEPLRGLLLMGNLSRYAYLRALGCRLALSTHISPGAQLHSPALLTLGPLVQIGELTSMTAHLSLGGKLWIAPISIGEATVIGADCRLGPGVRIGARVRVAAMVDIAPSVEIGDDVDIGPGCQIGMGVRIESGAALEPRSFVPSYAIVFAGERWGGDPAAKVGMVRRRRRRSLPGNPDGRSAGTPSS